MANDALIDFQGDGASSDSILSYVHIQTVGYSGSYNDYVVPAAANFPLAGLSSLGAAVTPSRYIVRLNFTPFSNGSLPILLKDVTSGGTSLSPVTGAPSLNQYRWWYSANNNTVSPDVIEFNSGQAGHTIAIDCYAKQSILHSDALNTIGKLYIGGQTYNGVALNVTSDAASGLIRGIFSIRQSTSGIWLMDFMISITVDNRYGSTYRLINIAGITYKNTAGYLQPILYGYSSSLKITLAYCTPNTNNITVLMPLSSIGEIINISGNSIELESKPTWCEY